MKDLIFKSITFFVLVIIIFNASLGIVFAKNENPYWEIQSIDTMKISRDLAREKANDSQFILTISREVANISSVGATHVAIGTPYDAEFIPYMKKWITEARKNGLNVWFRGNFSGWEGWFEYQKISPDEHLRKLQEFIEANPELFEDGDIFTSCTECENGGPGDPRDTKDVVGYRKFLVDEYDAASASFHKIGKNVKVNYFSMNADVAKLIMDKDTTTELGGVVVIDHYVKDPAQTLKDVQEIAQRSGGNVVLGEIGAPIPNIHGYLTSMEQAAWLEKTLSLLSNESSLLGINYWVASNGSTSLWNQDGSEKPAAEIVRGFYKPKLVRGTVENELRKPLKDVIVRVGIKETSTDSEGNFSFLASPSANEITLAREGYYSKEVSLDNLSDPILLERCDGNLFFKIQKSIYVFVQNTKKFFL